jgi:hypothetical protein
MADLVFFGLLAALLYAVWYWWPISAWVLAAFALYRIISDEVDWWRNVRPKCRTAAERRRSYLADWAARLGMLEISAMIDGQQPLPDGCDEGVLRKRVITTGVLSLGAYVAAAILILGWGSGLFSGGDSNHVFGEEVVDDGPAQEQPLTVTAQEQLPTDAERQYVKAYFSEELARCRAFLTIGENGKFDSDDVVISTSTTDEIDQVLLGLLGVETTAAKLKMWMDELIDEMDGDYTHFSRLIVKHGEFCQSLLEDPISRFEYWKTRARQQRQ